MTFWEEAPFTDLRLCCIRGKGVLPKLKAIRGTRVAAAMVLLWLESKFQLSPLFSAKSQSRVMTKREKSIDDCSTL
ncbi:hypothetical protein TorRG33x02_259890 [Trema orientale]|uniref:Uncharacterized protein n=1 Tax=Trema orientale TaxID=63057 RepID=A0A2P5D785_TREOI|nr:hypothetical protein TorRG33x02_259890 [Trema orientale]